MLHGLHKRRAPEGDAYAAVHQGLPREVANAWINAALGKGSPVKRWSKGRGRSTPRWTTTMRRRSDVS